MTQQDYNQSGGRTAGIQQTGEAGVLAGPHFYPYDGWNVVCETVTDASIQTTTRAFYTWGLDLSNTLEGAGMLRHSSPGTTAGGASDLFAAYTPGGNWFYAYDGTGNVTTLVSSSDGAVSATYDYSPFGLTVSKTGPAADANTYRFSTKWQDETGLYYYGTRYYNPTLGRWMSRDRGLLSFGGEVQQDYSFCQNNSACYIDFFGNIAEATDRDPRLRMLPVPDDYFDDPDETPDPEFHDPFEPGPPPPLDDPDGIPGNCQLESGCAADWCLHSQAARTHGENLIR